MPLLPTIIRLLILAALAAAPGACALSDWDGSGDGRPTVARNTPRPVPAPRHKPAVKKKAAKAAATSKSPTRARTLTVRVRKGDTVYGISRRHGVSTRALVNANLLKPPYRLAIGQKLVVPRARVYTVHKGDTGYGISRRFGVDVSQLMRLNRLRKPYRLRPGQRLRLPPSTRAPVTEQRVATSSEQKPAARYGFIWPVRGRIVSSFGPKKGGLHNDGINIRVVRQEPVRAADNGVVVYTGRDLKGFGNLLLLRHAGGWITAYGHNDTLLVRKGDTVKRGQIVARAGSTGSVRTPQLHFEIRKGTLAVDPLRYLPAAQAALIGE